MKRARLKLDKDFTIAKVDKRIFSTFIEPIGNTVYGSIYNPEHTSADEQGFREDVLELMRELKSTAIRYPGGNFVSGYNWMDGIGPKENRPVRYEKAWRSIETNQMGIDEYTDWVKKAGAEPMLAVNLGTGTPEEASHEIEYTNIEGGTYFSDLRKKNGYDKPHDIKLWCLGNEMDGTWQMGEKTAMEYGRIAYEAAKQMRCVDPEIELVACGSCANDKSHPLFPEWDRIVLEQCYDKVDYLSLHRYYSYDPESVKGTVFPAQFTPEDLPCISNDLSQFIDTVCAAADYVKGMRYSDKTINICFDEWGIMSSHTAKVEGLEWTEKFVPKKGERLRRANLIDAVLFGSLLITFINKCDRVKITCQSIVIGSMVVPKSERIVRITYTLKEEFSDDQKPGVIYWDTFTQWDFTQNQNEIRMNTSMLSLVINKETASIQYFDSSGGLLLKERSYDSKCLEEFDSYKIIDSDNVTIEQVKTPDGVKQVVREAAKTFDQKLYRTRLYLDWQQDEALYGLGQHEEGSLNLRGTTVYLHQANQKIAIPFLLSSLSDLKTLGTR